MISSEISKNNRISWIDVLKGIGIILVVVGHTGKDNFLVDWIYTFHMMLFFALSGYLWSQSSSKKTFTAFLISRVKTLLWPFVFFRIILVLYWVVVESHFRELDLGPIWFLIVLFVAEILGYLILEKHRDSIALSACIFIASVLILFALTILSPENSNYFSWILRFTDGFMWYVCGVLTGIICNNIKECSAIIKFSNKLRILALGGGGMLLTTVICFFNGNVSMWSNKFGIFPLFILGGIIGSLTLALFCKLFFSHNRILEFIGQNTVVILAFHEPIKRIVLKVFEVLAERIGLNISVDYIQHSIPASLLVVVVVVLISIVIVRIFKFFKNKLPGSVGDNLLAFVK